MKKIFFLFLLVLFLPLFSSRVLANVQNIDPQYIFVRKSPMHCNPSDCSYLWNGDDPNRYGSTAINDILDRVGTRGNDKRKLGIGVVFHYLERNFNNMPSSLQNLLNNAEQQDIPLFLAFDGFQWWNERSDLWNWWDINSPGYNPNNKNNVEWTCWDSSCAINKSWRNWGSETEIKPHPNLASRAFIEADKEKLNILLPVVVSWYKNLPADKKWLLGGIALTVETDFGGNYYYTPPNGGGLNKSQQLGYAAVKTLGLRSSGSPPTSQELTLVIQRYLDELNKLAMDLGIPREKIFGHVGGKGIEDPAFPFPSGINFPTIESAVSSFSQPGFSFYSSVTQHPENFPLLSSVLDLTGGNMQWAVPEWNPMIDHNDYSDWLNALRVTLNFRNAKFLNISNREEIRDNPSVLHAINTVLGESRVCWVTTPVLENVNISGNKITFNWQNGQDHEALYLNVTKQNDLNVNGTYKVINIANETVTGKSSYQMQSPGTGTYYWLLAADGCTSSGTQRRIAYGTFTLGHSPQYFGYYWGSEDINQVSQYTNAMLVDNIYQLDNIRNKGLKGIIILSGTFWDCSPGTKPCVLRSDWEQRWQNVWSGGYDGGGNPVGIKDRLGDIAALYPMDEPEMNTRQSDYQLVVAEIKKFTNLPLVMVMTYEGPSQLTNSSVPRNVTDPSWLTSGTLSIPSEVDWLGFDEYNCWDSGCSSDSSIPQQFSKIVNYIKPRGKKAVVIPDGFLKLPYSGNRTEAEANKIIWAQNYFDLCQREPDCIGMFTFLWKQPGFLGVSGMPNLESRLKELRERLFLSRPGDFNEDGKVDVLDLRQLLAGFTGIFDYNKIVEGFGSP